MARQYMACNVTSEEVCAYINNWFGQELLRQVPRISL